MGKTFVSVTAEHDPRGKTKPLWLNWIDGKQYEIDRVTDVRQAPALKAAGLGCGKRCRSEARKFICLRTRGDGSWRGEEAGITTFDQNSKTVDYMEAVECRG